MLTQALLDLFGAGLCAYYAVTVLQSWKKTGVVVGEMAARALLVGFAAGVVEGVDTGGICTFFARRKKTLMFSASLLCC